MDETLGLEKVEIEPLIRAARQEAKRWVDEVKAEGQLEREIRRRLDKRLDEIIGKLLGFDSRWGGWEVDHCNGRSGESAAGNWLRRRAGEAVQKWLDDQAGNLPSLPERAIKSLRNEYLHGFREELRRRLEEQAVINARRFLDETLIELTGRPGEP